LSILRKKRLAPPASLFALNMKSIVCPVESTARLNSLQIIHKSALLSSRPAIEVRRRRASLISSL
jgi:hypothetical protein